ncbi:MAG: GNAT family N-acetyltransferase [Bacteroidales bacterium]|nr:GNAT family N-acetyltransferase [Bacteroidales bacterium]
MIIPCEGILIKREIADGGSVAEIALMEGVVQNLTEKWTYPDGMPDSITFELIIEGSVIGQAGFKSIRWFNRKAELSLFIHPQYQEKKIGTKILKAMIAHAFDHLNLHRLEAEVIQYNLAGRKLVERLGFVKEGCLREAKYFDGKYFDILRYGLLKSEYGNIK